MKRQNIDFRQLLERLLPLDQLPMADRDSVDRALRSGVARQIEDAAIAALRQLETSGAVRRLPPASNGEGPLLRWQARDRLDVYTVHVPGPTRRDAWLIYPRASLPPQIRTGIEQVQHLLRIDDPALLSDPRHADPRANLAERLERAGRELLGTGEVVFVPADPESGVSSRLHPALAAELREAPDRIWYCPDLARATGLRPRLTAPAEGSLVAAGVSGPAGDAHGHLEIALPGRGAFRPEDLSLVALIADLCAVVLDRAARLEKLVFVDPMTSAHNRSYFELQLQKEMARAERERGAMALCIVDIDNFKGVNTSFGYQAGNEVLAHVAAELKRGVRPFDTVARWGGEEFVVLLTAPVQPFDVAAVCERLRSMVERQVVAIEGLDRRSHRVSVTVSVGVALYPDHAAGPEDLWRAANQALLQAKRPPKNQVVFYGGAPPRRLVRES